MEILLLFQREFDCRQGLLPKGKVIGDVSNQFGPRMRLCPGPLSFPRSQGNGSPRHNLSPNHRAGFSETLAANPSPVIPPFRSLGVSRIPNST